MAIQKQEFMVSEADGLNISVLTVLPEKEPYRAVVQLVHGMSEYKERYLPFMEYLAEQGYVSVIHDHRGHGKSIRKKEDLGYMFGGGAQAMIQDIDMVNRMIHLRFPKQKTVLFGHSMGSLAVRAFAAQHDSRIDMLIVCGSPSENPALGMGTGIAGLQKTLFGARHRSCLLETLSFGAGALRFRNDESCTAWICSDPAVAEEYKNSELCGFTFTTDGYLALFELMRRAYDTERFSCTNPHLPILFVSGADDPCMGNVRKFAKAVQAMRSAGYRDVRGKLYPGMRHEILNEKEKEKVYRDLTTYMEKKGL